MPPQGKRRLGPGQRHRVLRLIGGISVLAMLSFAVLESAADVEAGRRKTEVCVPCHGASGHSTNPAIPSLAGQPSLYTYYQLLLFQQQQRSDPQMAPFVANLNDADMQDIAAYYAAQPPTVPSGTSDSVKTEAGQKLVKAHYCDSCHAPGLVGQQHIPRLAGQQYEYLVKQLRAFKAQTRADMDGSMTMAAQPLSAEDIEMLAYYMAHFRLLP